MVFQQFLQELQRHRCLAVTRAPHAAHDVLHILCANTSVSTRRQDATYKKI